MQIVPQKRGEVAILIALKISFKAKSVIIDKKWCFIRMSVLQEDVMIINIYT